MKINNFLIGFLIIGSIFISNVSLLQYNQNISPDFKLGFEENEVKTYKIVSFNEYLSFEYLGSRYISDILGDYAYVGAYRFIQIDDIKYVNDLKSRNDNQNCSGWKLNISSWDWVTNRDWENREGDPDNIYVDIEIFRNPEDLGENFYNIEEMSYAEKYIFDYLNIPFVFPIKIENYLKEINWVDNWTINGREISIMYKESQGKFVEKILTFSNDGFLERSSLLTEKGQIIYDYMLENENTPIVFLIIIFIIVGIAILGIIYIFMKIE
ncbi:MAG: hypothetical protein ACFFDH_12615 [Promethearchaeota archaeon]